MKKGFLYYYQLWMEDGSLPNDGLCNSLPKQLRGTKAWKMVKPSEHETTLLTFKGKPDIYWGKEDWRNTSYSMTPRRQNILLLAAALNGEL